MRNILRAVMAVAAWLLIASTAAAASVRVAEGALSGASDGGVVSFKGIPFAAPPVGDLRWKPPQAPAAWDGVRDAKAYAPACPQPMLGSGGGRADMQDEDCLYLNVWAPEGAKDLPVMVWVHGGAHYLGAGSFPVYDGTNFAKQGVVLVTINYRIGLLGYFAHSALTAEVGPEAPLGNFGLMDQIAALEWVQKNISAFGGDPKNVTLFGESAGGASVIFLLAQPQAKGLFAKAIIESGGGLMRPAQDPLATQEATGARVAKAMGLSENATAEQLRAVPWQATLRALPAALGPGAGFGPFIDGRFVQQAPWRAFRAGEAIDVPTIVGANSNESSVLARLQVPFGPTLAGIMGGALPALRAAYGDVDQAEFERQAMGDAFFVAPARFVAEALAPGAPTYLYHFSYVLERRRGEVQGADHGTEIPFVFDSWEGLGPLARLLSNEDRAMTRAMQACWVSFARTGTPSCPPMPAWPTYAPETDLLLEFGVDSGVRSGFKDAPIDLMLNAFLANAGG